MTFLEALDLWEPALREVAAKKKLMEDNHYYTPYRLAYERAVEAKDALAAAIERLADALRDAD